METKVDSTVTTTVTIDKEKEIKIVSVPSCILLLFGEYLGYETPLIEWAEEWCTTKNFPSFKKDILNIDALSMLEKMHKDYTLEKIHYHWNMFYDIAIKAWMDKLVLNDTTITI